MPGLFTTNDYMDVGGRAMQEQLPRHEEHEVSLVPKL
jgi:hypothetical protein